MGCVKLKVDPLVPINVVAYGRGQAPHSGACPAVCGTLPVERVGRIVGTEAPIDGHARHAIARPRRNIVSLPRLAGIFVSGLLRHLQAAHYRTRWSYRPQPRPPLLP